MAAFVPRALAKGQKVPLPRRRTKPPGTVTEAPGVANVTGGTTGPNGMAFADAVDLNMDSPDSIDAESLVSHQAAGISDRGGLEERYIGVPGLLEGGDEGPESLAIEKVDGHSKKRSRGEVTNPLNDVLNLEVFNEDKGSLTKKRRVAETSANEEEVVVVFEESEALGIDPSSNNHGARAFIGSHIREEALLESALQKVNERGAAISIRPESQSMGVCDGRGDGVKDGASGHLKKQAVNKSKKVFPYGNYDRYYGYRFAKTLSEDPRLSLFKKEWFQGKACLDVGCNEGYVTIAVAQKFECASMVGVDIDGSLVAKAKNHLKREAAVLRQANKPQHRRLDLAGQADHPGVRQTLLGGAQSRELGGGLNWKERRKQRMLALESVATDDSKATDQEGVSRSPVEKQDGREVTFGGPANGDVSSGVVRQGPDVSGKAEEGGVSGRPDNERSREENGNGLWTMPQSCTLSSVLEADQLGPLAQWGGPLYDQISPPEKMPTEGGVLDGHEGKFGHREGSIEGAIEEPITSASAAEGTLEQTHFPRNVHFRKENFIESSVEEEKYDVVMSLSVVKWIHLNSGDEGLLRFFTKVYKGLKPGGLFILEPQPWKSYKNNRAVSETTQRYFKEIKIMPERFSNVLQKQIGFRTADIVSSAVPGSLGGFGRPIYLYRK